MSVYEDKGKGLWIVERRFTILGQPFRRSWSFRSQREAKAHDGEFGAQVKTLRSLARLGKLSQADLDAAVGRAGGQIPRSSFTAFSTTWLDASEGRLRETTISAYRKHLRLYLRPVLGDVPMRGINAGDVERLQASLLARGHNENGTRRVLATLSAILAAAERWGVIDSNPMRRVAKVKVPAADGDGKWTILAPDEEAAVLAAAAATWRPFFAFALATGLRKGELIALEHADIDKGVVVVRRSATLVHRHGEPRTWQTGPPKSGHARRIPLGPKATAACREQAAALRGMKLVFPSLTGGPYRTPDEIRGAFVQAVKKAGIQRAVRFHDLRHTWASRHVAAGTPPEVLRRLGGWSSLAMVQRYGHATTDAMERAQGQVG